MFFSTALNEENAKAYPTKYISVQHWKTTRKAPHASRLEDFIQRIPDISAYILFEFKEETKIQVDLYKDLILVSSRSESESESSFNSLEFPTKIRPTKSSYDDARRHEVTAPSVAKEFKPQDLSMEETQKKGKIVVPAKEAMVDAVTEKTSRDGVETPLTRVFYRDPFFLDVYTEEHSDDAGKIGCRREMETHQNDKPTH